MIKEDKPIKGLILNAEAAFNEVREQIANRIKEIENRLINFDDVNERRLELRGELKGLRYSQQIMDSNR